MKRLIIIINIFLLIIALVAGGYMLYKNLFNKAEQAITDIKDEMETVTGPMEEIDKILDGSSNISNGEISEEELIRQIKNKRYLENTYLALQYSKVNNRELRTTLKNYLDDNTQMKPKDVSHLIDLHERTFLNRYLKVFVITPDEELHDLNSKMRRIFYQMKLGFDTLNQYSNESDSIVNPKDKERPLYKEPDVDYKPENIRQGISQLESADSLVDEALEELGRVDVVIERQWLESGLSESDITDIIDKTNVIQPNLNNDSLDEMELQDINEIGDSE